MRIQRATLTYGTANGANPGDFLGGVGMMFSLLGLATFGTMSAIGFFISLAAMRKSHKAGYTNGYAKWGLIAGCPPVICWGGFISTLVVGSVFVPFI